LRARLTILVIVVGLFYHPLFVSAAPSIEATLKPNRAVKAGQICALTLQVAWPNEEGDYRFSQPELVLENLTVKETGESSETFQRDGEGWRKKIFRFQLKALEKGEGKIRAFRLIYVNPQTGEGGNLQVDTLKIKIQADRTAFYRLLFIVLGLTLGISLTGGGLFFLRHSHQKKQPEVTWESTLEDRYLSQLNVVPSQPAEAGKLFRSYLMEKFRMTSGSYTIRELISRMENMVSPNELKTLKGIFDKLDQHIFGPRVAQSGNRELYLEMIHFVEGKRTV